jgi:hypothetical protein
MIAKLLYASPVVVTCRVVSEDWIATSVEQLSIINPYGSIGWDGEDTLGDEGGPYDGGTEGGNLVVHW